MFLAAASAWTNIGAALCAGPIPETFTKFSARLTTTSDHTRSNAARPLILGRIAQQDVVAGVHHGVIHFVDMLKDFSQLFVPIINGRPQYLANRTSFT